MKVYENTGKNILNRFSVSFKNPKNEEDFDLFHHEYRIKMNKILIICLLIVSIGILLWESKLANEVNVELLKKRVEIYSIDDFFVGNLSNNFSDNSSLILSGSYVYYNKFILVNSTIFESYSENFTKNLENYLYKTPDPNIVRKYIFMRWAIPLCISSVIAHIILLIFSFAIFSLKFHKILFCLIFSILGINFHIISGTLRSFLLLSSDFIFFIVAIQLFFKILMTVKVKTPWLFLLITCLITGVLEWTLFFCIHYSNHETISLYFLVNSLIHVAAVMLSFHNELKSKKEFYYARKMHFDNEYLVNFIYNMDQGFITLDNKEVLFINKSMNNMMGEYERLMSLCHHSSQIEKEQICCEMHSDLNLQPIKNSETVLLNIETLNLEDRSNFLLSNTRNFSSHVKKNSKKILERILENLTEVNNFLPDDILKVFKKSGNSENFSIETNSFDIDLLYESLKLKKENFRDYSYFGIMSFKKKCPSQDNFDYFLNKTFEVILRVITHHDKKDYLEIMFADISKVLHHEREKAIENCRSIYLSKIAHEFKNPLISLIELSTSIGEETTQNLPANSNVNLNRISQMSDYSLNICKIMNLFLRDFSLITDMKFPCENKCQNSSHCNFCKTDNFCTICRLCAFCERKKFIDFDHKKILIDFCETFNTLAEHEQKSITINLEFDTIDNIKTDSELFYSIIYNLIYHSYKNTQKGEIFIKSGIKNLDNFPMIFDNSPNKSKEVDVLFEISDSSLQIDENFIKKLNHKLIEDDSFYEEDHCDKFNKYFNIYVASCLVRKLGMNLKIDSSDKGTVYSFVIKAEFLPSSPSFAKKFQSGCVSNSHLDFKLNNFKLEKNNSDRTFKELTTSPKKGGNTAGTLLNSLSTIKMSFRPKLTTNNKFSLIDPTLICDDPIDFNYNGIIFEQNEENDLHNIYLKNLKNESLSSSSSSNFDERKLNFHQLDLTTNRRIKSTDKIENIQANGKQIRLLIIDDEALIRKTLHRFVNKMNEKNEFYYIQFYEAKNCFEALDIIYKKYEENLQFDYVVIDEHMPNMKGSTLIKLMKQLYTEKNFYNIVFISHTAFDTPEKKKFIMESGADYFLSKPQQFSEFKDFIEGLIMKSNNNEK